MKQHFCIYEIGDKSTYQGSRFRGQISSGNPKIPQILKICPKFVKVMTYIDIIHAKWIKILIIMTLIYVYVHCNTCLATFLPLTNIWSCIIPYCKWQNISGCSLYYNKIDIFRPYFNFSHIKSMSCH